ncbi:MAG TPA: hypothetical protein VJJ24_01770 [Candidatus Paceibacterota bacterium]
MELSEESIAEFANIWKEQFGETLSRDRADMEAKLLLEFYYELSRPLPSEKEEKASHRKIVS